MAACVLVAPAAPKAAGLTAYGRRGDNRRRRGRGRHCQGGMRLGRARLRRGAGAPHSLVANFGPRRVVSFAWTTLPLPQVIFLVARQSYFSSHHGTNQTHFTEHHTPTKKKANVVRWGTEPDLSQKPSLMMLLRTFLSLRSCASLAARAVLS